MHGTLLLMAPDSLPSLSWNTDTTQQAIRPPSLVLIQWDHPGSLPLHLTISILPTETQILTQTGSPSARPHLYSSIHQRALDSRKRSVSQLPAGRVEVSS